MDQCVSVIMPTYQRAPIIGRAVRSVLNQRGIPDWKVELVVVDDGSTDDTPGAVASVPVPPPHEVKLVRMPHSGRPGLVRNEGIRRSTGAYIGYCDSDDIWLPHHLATCLHQFRLCPHLVMVETWWSFQVLERSPAGWRIDYAQRDPDGPTTTTNSRLHTRSVLDLVGLFSDQVWGEDIDLWTRIAFAGPVRRVKVPTTVNSYTRLGDNVTFRFEPDLAKEFNARIRLFTRLGDHLRWANKCLAKGVRNPSWLVSRTAGRLLGKGRKP
jgi:glycosyltransferase involved in cell wall biosynthesis